MFYDFDAEIFSLYPWSSGLPIPLLVGNLTLAREETYNARSRGLSPGVFRGHRHDDDV